MTPVPARHPREGLDLTVRAYALRRGGANAVALRAALDQARASVSREPDPTVARALTWVGNAIDPSVPDEDVDDLVVGAALQVAARGLGPLMSDDPGGAA